MKKSATISSCGKYRYRLSRVWDFEGETVCFIGLNPSTADASNDDPTIRRCINYAKSWGYGGIVMVNLFCFRATNPKDMKAQGFNAKGRDSNEFLIESSTYSAITIAAWGTQGNFLGRDKQVKDLIKSSLNELHYLKLTKDNHPSHPLYLKKDLKPQKWEY